MLINKRSAAIALAGLAIFSFLSCDNDADETPVTKTKFTISASANGANEVPAVTTSATGTATGNYDSTTNVLNYTVTWTGLTANASAMHFHGPALPGANAGVAVGITGFPTATAGTHTGTATLTQAQEADMFAGKWYWNVHTSTNPTGEIRGQVSVQ